MHIFSKKYIFKLSALTLFLFAPISHAAIATNSIYFDPNPSSFDISSGVGSLGLWMDFTDTSLGGGIDMKFTGAISFNRFVESSHWGSEFDSSFSDHGSALATAGFDYEVHVGNFATGILPSGPLFIGDVIFNLLGEGTGELISAFNEPVTGAPSFLALNGDQLVVELSGAQVSVNAVPVPAAVWFMLSAIGSLGLFNRRKQKSNLG